MGELQRQCHIGQTVILETEPYGATNELRDSAIWVNSALRDSAVWGEFRDSAIQGKQ